MHHSIKFYIELVSLSGVIWMLLGFYVLFSIKHFIVERYEQETDLCNSTFFTQHMPYTKHLPNMFSASLYAGHLLSFVWGWKIIKLFKEKRPQVTYFNDIDHPEEVTSHFTGKELRRVKWSVISAIVVITHVVVYLVFRFLWPELFK